MRRLFLAIALLSVAAPFAAAKTKPKGHAPEMAATAMAIAGLIGVGGYLAIRRRTLRQN
ncbi:MAG TPA: hypothetical protein VNY81_04950 [Candidatus Saccharimonadales bacterium]|jgi:MYXO-CTERM domain-containing protein|nr:hypothetical protein [Candidatus Saccharimonadales bacterium]